MIIEGCRLDSNDDSSLFSNQETLDKTLLAPIYLKINNFQIEFPPLDGKSLMIIGYVNNVYIRSNQLIGDIFILDKFYNGSFSVDWIDYQGTALFGKSLIICNPESLGLDKDTIHNTYYNDDLNHDYDIVKINNEDISLLRDLYQQRDSTKELITFYIDISDTDDKEDKTQKTLEKYQKDLQKIEKDIIKQEKYIKTNYIPSNIKSQSSTLSYSIDIDNGVVKFYAK